MTMRQIPRRYIDDMNECVSDEENRKSQVHGARTINIPCGPRERQSNDQVYDTQITNEVGIKRTCVGNVCREVGVPRAREEKHPRSINEAEDARYYIKEP
jgi:hypothetical protein